MSDRYSTLRLPQSGVPLSLSPGFLAGCSCPGDCGDQAACACHSLTLEASRAVGVRAGGYSYRRLEEPVVAGVWECNQNCACSNTCLNRVAQRPLNNPLQVTTGRWALPPVIATCPFAFL